MVSFYLKSDIPDDLQEYFEPAEIGLEKTPEEYVARLVEVFREVRRVLRLDGVLFLNLGDSYASGKGTCYNPGGGDTSLGKVRKGAGVHPLDRGNVSDLRDQGLKPKDLIGIPWRVAFALQADGWYLRSDIIWHKPNPMPESVRDRCTKAHEYVFMLTKSARYFYDNEAVKEPAAESTNQRDKYKRCGYNKETRNGFVNHLDPHSGDFRDCHGLRNRRDVWTIATKPYKGAHFAVFPEALAEVCIKAGCPEYGVVLDPFAGSGTTGAVAKSLGRDYILIEANQDYIALVKERVSLAAAKLGG